MILVYSCQPAQDGSGNYRLPEGTSTHSSSVTYHHSVNIGIFMPLPLGRVNESIGLCLGWLLQYAVWLVPTGWLPVHRGQLWAQRSVTSIIWSPYLLLTDGLIRLWKSKVKGQCHSRPLRSILVNTIILWTAWAISMKLTDYLIRFWKSKGKVTQWFKYVLATAYTSTLGCPSLPFN